MTRIRGHRLNFPSLMGAYLAVNAIPDAYILVDGPDCALYKAHFIHGRHDLNSTLLDIDGKHRVCFTNVCAQSVTKDHNELILRKLHALENLEGPRIILLTSLPGCSITGLDYEHLMRSASMFMAKESLAIPPTSLTGDWIDGYTSTMLALARHIDFKGTKPKKDKIAIVGYLMDRNEGDHHGNLKEFRRLMKALDLDLVSVWLGGDPYDKLKEAGNARTIVSLPYGRGAAEDIAKKTGATIVEAALPFGMAATERFLLQIAEATGRTEKARKLIAVEKDRILGRLEWIVPYLFLHKDASFIGDPHFLDGFVDICEDMGMSLKSCFLTSRQRPVSDKVRAAVDTILFEPDIYHPEVNAFLGDPTDLVVTSTNEITRVIRWHTIDKLALVEHGFPSYFYHAFSDSPFLGFEGMLHFVERMADALSNMRRLTLLRGGDKNDDADDRKEEYRKMTKEAAVSEPAS